jgi:hypothetical protein
MGHLLSSAIKMQGGAPATATLQYELFANGESGTFNIYKNGTLYQSMTTNTSLVSITLNAGDTFYSTIQSSAGSSSVDYFVNGSYVTSYFIATTGTLTTPTITSAGGSTYKYTGNFGAI